MFNHNALFWGPLIVSQQLHNSLQKHTMAHSLEHNLPSFRIGFCMNIHNENIINLVVFNRCGKFNSQPCQPICLNWFSAQTTLAEMPQVVSRTRLINPNRATPRSCPIQLNTEANVKGALTKTEYKDRKLMRETLFHCFIHGLARGLGDYGFIQNRGLNFEISHNEAKNQFKLLFSKAKKKRKIKQ